MCAEKGAHDQSFTHVGVFIDYLHVGSVRRGSSAGAAGVVPAVCVVPRRPRLGCLPPQPHERRRCGGGSKARRLVSLLDGRASFPRCRLCQRLCRPGRYFIFLLFVEDRAGLFCESAKDAIPAKRRTNKQADEAVDGSGGWRFKNKTSDEAKRRKRATAATPGGGAWGVKEERRLPAGEHPRKCTARLG